jgi:signal peptidase I
VWVEVSGPQDSGPQDSASQAPQAGPEQGPQAADKEAADEQAGDKAQADEQAGPGAAAASAGEPEPGPDPESEAPQGGRAKRKQRSFWRELPVLIVIALVLAVLIKTFAVQAFWIPSGSMENTLEINDRVLVNKIVYHIRDIHRGDIVVFNGDGSWDPGPLPANGNVFQQFGAGFASMFGFGHPGDILIKRVIGIPGDHVACCDAQGRVTVNGVPLTEQSYLYPGSAPSLSRFNIVVQPGRLWVMGDNRFYSADSRDHMGDPGGGTVPESAVIGRAFVIIWPPSRWRILPIPATFTQPALNGSHASAAPPSVQAQGTDLLPARVEPTGQAIPLTLGFAGAIPLTWLQRRVRLRARRRRCDAPARPSAARPGRPARRWRPARRRPVGPR